MQSGFSALHDGNDNMKKTLVLFISIVLLLLNITSAYAEVYYEYEDFTYYLDNEDGAVISEYSGDSDTIIVPSSLGGEAIRAIGFSAFSGLTNVKKIVLPDTLYYIYPAAFKGMTSLTSINIPKYCRSFSKMAFEDCSSITDIDFSTELISTIGAQAFKNCTSLQEVEIPDGVTSIDSFAFQNCTSLNSITIPPSVTNIVSSAFSGCGNFTIKGVHNSYAEQFAKDKGYKFEYVNPLWGDSNDDGKFNIRDATAIQFYKIGQMDLTDYGKICADVDHNDTINIRDVTYIQMKIAKIELPDDCF